MIMKNLEDFIPEEKQDEFLQWLEEYTVIARKLQCATARGLVQNWLPIQELKEQGGINWHRNYNHVFIKAKEE